MKNVLLLSFGMFTLGFDAYVIAGLIPGISETYHKNLSQVGQAVSIFTFFLRHICTYIFFFGCWSTY